MLLRKEKMYSQEKLAEISKSHRTHISAIERGETNVSLEQIAKLAVALEVDLPELFQLDDLCS